MIKQTVLESYKEYGRVLCISNGVVEAYVTIDVGPRIIRFGSIGGQNFMRDDRGAFQPKNDEVYQSFFGAGRQWENLGGHRIWLSPESYPDTYYPSSEPVAYELTPNGAVFTPPAVPEIGAAFALEIRMDEDDANMQVTMRVTNIGEAEKRFSIWGLTVSAQGGTVIVPMNTNDTGLLANRIIAVWPYTDMSDSRIYWGKKYVTVKQDPAAAGPMKLGFDLNCGTAYYVLGDEVFCKHYDTEHPDAEYPDGGCSFETYTCDQFIEIESLGRLNTVKPNETVENTESWSLCKKPCEVDLRNDDSIDDFLNRL